MQLDDWKHTIKASQEQSTEKDGNLKRKIHFKSKTHKNAAGELMIFLCFTIILMNPQIFLKSTFIEREKSCWHSNTEMNVQEAESYKNCVFIYNRSEKKCNWWKLP